MLRYSLLTILMFNFVQEYNSTVFLGVMHVDILSPFHFVTSVVHSEQKVALQFYQLVPVKIEYHCI
jgi:hypothetical protein